MRALLLFLALTTGATGTANAGNPIVGTWVGELPNDPEDITVELTIAHIDDQGLGYGMLCHIWGYLGVTYIWDLGVGPGTAATPELVSRGRVSITFSFNDVEYTFLRPRGNTLGLHLKRRGQLHKFRLQRTAREAAPCISRIEPRATHPSPSG